MKSNDEKPFSKNLRAYFKEQSTRANAQFRIAGITLAVAIVGFMSKSWDISDPFKMQKAVGFSIIFALLGSASGFLAWKFSAKMFYAYGEGFNKTFWHTLKDTCDALLWIFLVASIISFLFYLF